MLHLGTVERGGSVRVCRLELVNPQCFDGDRILHAPLLRLPLRLPLGSPTSLYFMHALRLGHILAARCHICHRLLRFFACAFVLLLELSLARRQLHLFGALGWSLELLCPRARCDVAR